jgi:hypothetical protein
MAYDYIPRPEAEMAKFTTVLLRHIEREPGEYGLVQAQVDRFREVHSRFMEVYSLVKDAETRTRPKIVLKDERKRELISATRQIVDVMQAWEGMTDAKRIALGITVRGPRARRVHVPTDGPSVGLDAAGRNVSIALDSGLTRSKPAGVLGALLFVCYGDEPPTRESDWKFLMMTGRTRVNVRLDEVREACTVWITACWFNGRMETGPYGEPREIHLAKSAVPKLAHGESSGQRVAA